MSCNVILSNQKKRGGGRGGTRNKTDGMGVVHHVGQEEVATETRFPVYPHLQPHPVPPPPPLFSPSPAHIATSPHCTSNTTAHKRGRTLVLVVVRNSRYTYTTVCVCCAFRTQTGEGTPGQDFPFPPGRDHLGPTSRKSFPVNTARRHTTTYSIRPWSLDRCRLGQ